MFVIAMARGSGRGLRRSKRGHRVFGGGALHWHPDDSRQHMDARRTSGAIARADGVHTRARRPRCRTRHPSVAAAWTQPGLRPNSATPPPVPLGRRRLSSERPRVASCTRGATSPPPARARTHSHSRLARRTKFSAPRHRRRPPHVTYSCAALRPVHAKAPGAVRLRGKPHTVTPEQPSTQEHGSPASRRLAPAHTYAVTPTGLLSLAHNGLRTNARQPRAQVF